VVAEPPCTRHSERVRPTVLHDRSRQKLLRFLSDRLPDGEALDAVVTFTGRAWKKRVVPGPAIAVTRNWILLVERSPMWGLLRDAGGGLRRDEVEVTWASQVRQTTGATRGLLTISAPTGRYELLISEESNDLGPLLRALDVEP